MLYRIFAAATLTALAIGAAWAFDLGTGVAQTPAYAEIISTNGANTCVVAEAGNIVCWGSSGQTFSPDGSFTQVSKGGYHSCGVTDAGAVKCWGFDGDGQASPPEGAFVQVSAGGVNHQDMFGSWGRSSGHTCAVTAAGTVECWGVNEDGQATPPSGRFTQVSAGAYHTCGVTSAGTVECWGDDVHGQARPPEGHFTQVGAGEFHTCGVTRAGEVQCWGHVSSPPSGTFTQVSAGRYHTCGVTTDGPVRCWGVNDQGQATPPEGRFTQVTAGARSEGDIHGTVENDLTCGVTIEGVIKCWGYDNYGQASPPDGTFAQVSVGRFSTCGLTSEGAIQCWGLGYSDQASPPPGRFTQVSAREGQDCGLRTSGIVVCWGSDYSKAASPVNGTFTQISENCGVTTAGRIQCWGLDIQSPAISPDDRFTQVSVGTGLICGLTSDGAVKCLAHDWRHNFSEYGTDDGFGGREIPSGTRFTQISVGSANTAGGPYAHGCGVTRAGTVECWGRDIGDPPSGTFTQVSAGRQHTCGVTSDGAIQCWGWNSAYDLTHVPSERFVQISTSKHQPYLYPDTVHSCGVTTSGAVKCWGDDWFGITTPPAGLRARVPESSSAVDDSAHQESSATELRIVARRLADDRTEFGVQTPDGERVLPRSRFFPANAAVDRWLNSSLVSIDGQEVGRINARRLANGRIEFAFTPAGGERILPSSRFFPAGATIDRWLRSTQIEVGG